MLLYSTEWILYFFEMSMQPTLMTMKVIVPLVGGSFSYGKDKEQLQRNPGRPQIYLYLLPSPKQFGAAMPPCRERS